MVLVVIVLDFEIIIFCFVVAMSILVHDVEVIHDLKFILLRCCYM